MSAQVSPSGINSAAATGRAGISGSGPSFSPLRIISMFAGIGGFDLGLERTGGFKTIAVAEVDPYASQVLALRFPDAVNLGDVTKAEYPDADVICAGFPCQDISYAGAGAGLAGARSGLFWEVVRAIGVVRPQYVILENVAALLSRGLDVVLKALAEVGYDAEWHCIPASAVGAPHRRDRIWIIAYPRSEQHEGGCAPISGTLAAQLFGAVADADSELRERPRLARNGWDEPANSSQDLADAGCVDAQGFVASFFDTQEWAGPIERLAGPCNAGIGGFWAIEPDVGRVANGIPKRVDRLKALGNAIVPQVAELIGNAILASLNARRDDRRHGFGETK